MQTESIATKIAWQIDKSLTSTEKYLLIALSRMSLRDDLLCWPSVKKIATDTNMDRKSVINIRQKLIKKGFIIYTGEMKGRSQQIPVIKLVFVEKYLQEEKKKLNLRNFEPPVDNSKKIDQTDAHSDMGGSSTCNMGGGSKGGTRKLLKGSFKRNRASDTPVDNFESETDSDYECSDYEPSESIPKANSWRREWRPRKGWVFLTTLPDSFYPNAAGVEKLMSTAQRVNMSAYELFEKFKNISIGYNTKSADWQEYFCIFMDKERPKKVFEDAYGKRRRYDNCSIY